ncbi:IclR family transcriptional regulator domain-containing protein [Nocardiopsis sp. LOL_012]|uniref:IclR family transcriptional regulator domain-containing protein n=1 Tax=Nocardiopsis sp. LOL_012 TaxID=3345409 RepID=UPI003A8AFA41
MWERVLGSPLRAYTPATLTGERELRAEIAEVRRRGFAFCPGHIHSDATGLAVPVRRDGHVVAALGLVVPNDDSAWALSRPLMLAGLSLSRALSGTVPEGPPSGSPGGDGGLRACREREGPFRAGGRGYAEQI